VTMLSDLDREILDILQNKFPLAVQPYLLMANHLGISEDQLLDRIADMKKSGLIRRIGGIMDSRKLGFHSTLCAVAVPEARIASVAKAINQLQGVTHNYLRDHDYNMWFTLTAPSYEEVLEIIEQLENLLGLKINNMPAQKVYKIKVSFDMGNVNEI
jgi:DNA-binding Lrp family transcriptional regulator